MSDTQIKIDNSLIDRLVKDCKTQEDVFGKEGLFTSLKKAIMERILETEMTHHLGYSKHSRNNGISRTNARNGISSKIIKTKEEAIPINIPRDREGSYDPQFIGKWQRKISGFDDKIISMYARGMSTREIQEHLEEIYGMDVSPDLISDITDSVIGEVESWQNRVLESHYAIAYMDALRVKIRDNGFIQNKSIYMIIGVTMDGYKEVLGLWISETEGAKFWLKIMTELKNRGVQDIFIACVDGLKGFPEAINSIFPKTKIQLCIVHMVRYSLNYVPWKDRKLVASDLKKIYTANNEEGALQALSYFEDKWGKKYPTIVKSWTDNWDRLITFLDYPSYIRKAIYTTNAIESANRSIKKTLKVRSVFPNDKSALKLTYLALKNITKRWTMPIKEWKQALNQFAIEFEDRLPQRQF